MIPKVFHWIWPGQDPLRSEVERLRETWMRHHSGWEFRVWRDTDLTWLRNYRLFARSTSYAQKADIARYEVVERFGGVYLDTDMECLRPIDGLIEGLDFFGAREPGGPVCPSIFGASAGHPLLRQTIAGLSTSALIWRSSGIATQTSPGYFTRIVNSSRWEHADGVAIFPPPYFYPYNYDEPGRREETFPTAFAVHRWHHSWKNDEPVQVHLSDLRPRTPSDTYAMALIVWWSLRERARNSVRYRVHAPAKRLVKSGIRRAASSLPRPLAGVPFGPDRVLVKGPLGVRLLCPAEDISIVPELVVDGTYEPDFVDFLASFLRPGMTFVDVGANLGLFTIIAARLVGSGGRVVGYECNPDLLVFLEQNAAMNWVQDRVTIVPRAAGRSRQVVSFHAPTEMKGGGSTVLALADRTARSAGRSVEVEVEDLDSSLSGLGFVDVMKIDVEGGEADVLAGMEKLIVDKRVGLIALEYMLDVIDDRHRTEMEERLRDFETLQGATFFQPGGRGRLSLSEVLTTAMYRNLLIRFPWSTIDIT